jgi:hypothetical protein
VSQSQPKRLKAKFKKNETKHQAEKSKPKGKKAKNNMQLRKTK